MAFGNELLGMVMVEPYRIIPRSISADCCNCLRSLLAEVCQRGEGSGQAGWAIEQDGGTGTEGVPFVLVYVLKEGAPSVLVFVLAKGANIQRVGLPCQNWVRPAWLFHFPLRPFNCKFCW